MMRHARRYRPQQQTAAAWLLTRGRRTTSPTSRALSKVTSCRFPRSTLETWACSVQRQTPRQPSPGLRIHKHTRLHAFTGLRA